MARRPKKIKDIEQAIRSGNAPAGLIVNGKLSFAGDRSLQSLPPALTVGWLDLSTCTGLQSLPRDLRARRITLSGNWNPRPLLDGLTCYHLELQNTQIADLPADLKVEHRLELEGCTRLTTLPQGLKVGCLILRGCTSLRELPEDLDCYFLDISGCTEIESWPRRATVSIGRFTCRGCIQIRDLPPWLTSIAQLDLRDCVNIRSIPDHLHVNSWIDIAGTRIQSLPPHLKSVQLRWRGVAIDERIALSPETITSDEILAETNAERRRVLLERMGYEFFLKHAKAQVLDQDRDAGGQRQLLRVDMKNDEALVCVSVLCPSTARQYVIRVPPTMKTCHEAVAWVAGFDNPNDYRPLVET